MSNELAIAEVADTIPSLAKADEEVALGITRLFQSIVAVPEGMEETDTSWRPDIMKIRQSNTTDAMLPADAQMGALWAAGQTLWQPSDGEQKPLLFVPVYRWLSHARFQPGQRSPDCRSDDGKWNIYGTQKCEECPDLPWRNGEMQLCRRSQNYIIVPLNFAGIYHVQFSKTGYTTGNVIAKTAKSRGHMALWENVFGLTTQKKTNSAGQSWFVFDVTPHLHVKEDDATKELGRFVYQQYKGFRERLLAGQERARENADAVLAASDVDLSVEESDSGFEDSM
jgi:hypothetical protein